MRSDGSPSASPTAPCVNESGRLGGPARLLNHRSRAHVLFRPRVIRAVDVQWRTPELGWLWAGGGPQRPVHRPLSTECTTSLAPSGWKRDGRRVTTDFDLPVCCRRSSLLSLARHGANNDEASQREWLLADLKGMSVIKGMLHLMVQVLPAGGVFRAAATRDGEAWARSGESFGYQSRSPVDRTAEERCSSSCSPMNCGCRPLPTTRSSLADGRQALVESSQSAASAATRQHQLLELARGVDNVGVLPDSHYRPICHVKQLVGVFVASAVAWDLVSPETGVGPGDRVVVGTPVPKASIDEDSNAKPGKDDVCRTAEGIDRATMDDAPEPSSVQLSSDRQLVPRATAPIGTHGCPKIGARSPRRSSLGHIRRLVPAALSACRPGRASVGAILVARYGGLSFA